MAWSAVAQDLTHADILVATQASAREQQAARMVQEEVEKRTQVDWAISAVDPHHVPGARGGQHVVLAERRQMDSLLREMHLAVPAFPKVFPPESFSIRRIDHDRVLLIAGADERGVLFGAGYLLRHLDMVPGRVTPHGIEEVDSAPAYPVRGHQLGYRPKNNTFDGWTAQQFEQYIRDLAVFGTNTIEIIPPRSDDDAVSPLFTEAPLPMMEKLSAILDRYGLDCSIWYPALDKDYSNPAVVDAAVKEWGAVFDRLPRIDAVFVPGGDPGHTEPKYLFALLEKEAARLRVNHPKAQMWVSPQSFSASWLAEFYTLLAQHPAWLTGVVYGPEMRDSPEEFRRKVPAGYPVRFYPDITHTLGAQYPVPLWDPAFALTEGREPIDPRPVDEGILFHRYAPFSNGFVAYSEGSNDDVNKVLWSAWGWNPSATAAEILEQYGRYFISPASAPQIAKAAQSLEENWRGPLLENRSVRPTLALLQQIETQQIETQQNGEQQNGAKQVVPVAGNWRLQQLLYRGYYDAFVQERLQRETAAQNAAIQALRDEPLTEAGLQAAAQALPTPTACSENVTCRRVQQLAGDLFGSIRMQLSVEKYQALAVDRGANLDRIEAPLTSSPWLRTQIERAKAAPSLEERTSIVQAALRQLGAMPLGAYDDLGDPARQPHLVSTASFQQDPSGLQRTYLGVETSARTANLPLPLRTFAGTLYDRPLEMQYEGLPPGDLTAQIDLLGGLPGDARKLAVRANGTLLTPVCESSALCLHPTYAIAGSVLQGGRLRLALSAPPGLGGNGRSLRVAAARLVSHP